MVKTSKINKMLRLCKLVVLVLVTPVGYTSEIDKMLRSVYMKMWRLCKLVVFYMLLW